MSDTTQNPDSTTPDGEAEVPAPQAPEAPEAAAAETTDAPEAAAAEPAAPEAAPADESGPDEAPAAEAAPDEAPVAEATSEEAPAADEAPAAETPKPAPRPGPVPSPAAIARAVPRPPVATPPVATVTDDHSASAAFGRVADDGTVFVRTAEGEREVGSYPGATNEEALTYFARKYDELFASAVLLEQRADQPEVPSKDVHDALRKLREQVAGASVVGDLDAMEAKLTHVETRVAAKREEEQAARAKAREVAKVEREKIVAEAEGIADQPEGRIQWKASGQRMRELLEEWKQHQRSSTRLDRETETALWQRFSSARNRFDKARRSYFASLDAAHAEAKSTKERLVAEAEALSSSTDWSATAGAFKRLMDQWRRAGRASRADDDRLWARFKAAQDAFFAAKDEVVAAEEESYRGNLAVKEQLLAEAEGILPVTDLEKAKAQLRSVQDRWDAAGRVPRADMDRIEKALRRIEQAVRDADERRWASTNPEAAARAQGMVDQLERAVADLQKGLEKARATGDERKIAKAQEALDARQAWLDQARAGVAEFGGR